MRKKIGITLIVIGLLTPVPYVYLKYIHSPLADNAILGWSVAIGTAIAVIGARVWKYSK